MKGKRKMTMYELLEKLEALIEKWENAPYTGDYTSAARAVCAGELRAIIGPTESMRRWAQDRTEIPSRREHYDDELPF